MIGALKEWFYTVKAIDKHVCNLYDAVKLKQVYVNRLRDKQDLMQHQIDQLSAAVIELRNANMARQEQDQQKQSRAKRTAAKKQPTKGKQ